MKKITSTDTLNAFMSRVNKLSVGRSTSDEIFGTVTLKSAATCKSARKFAVSNSSVIHNGAYKLGGIRQALTNAICA